MAKIGTAGWSIPKAHNGQFTKEGTHLERYARRLQAVEVNSSFYRDHQEATYYRWAYTTPEEFRFSVKFPRRYTHEGMLTLTAEQAKSALEPIFGLREKLGVILVQLPPKLQFEVERAKAFFGTLRELYAGNLACEPRHPTWGQAEALDFFLSHKISKVQADPEPCPATDAKILSSGGFTYHRLHGSPEIYRSAYSPAFLEQLASTLEQEEGAWCIFDNTTFGHATHNAIQLQDLIAQGQAREVA